MLILVQNVFLPLQFVFSWMRRTVSRGNNKSTIHVCLGSFLEAIGRGRSHVPGTFAKGMFGWCWFFVTWSENLLDSSRPCLVPSLSAHVFDNSSNMNWSVCISWVMLGEFQAQEIRWQWNSNSAMSLFGYWPYSKMLVSFELTGHDMTT